LCFSTERVSSGAVRRTPGTSETARCRFNPDLYMYTTRALNEKAVGTAHELWRASLSQFHISEMTKDLNLQIGTWTAYSLEKAIPN